MGFDFSSVAAKYAAYRPRYPAALVDALVDAAPAARFAWEAGCGNGQLTTALAERFDHIVATDPSQQQIANAVAHPKVTYRVAPAEDGIAETGADLCVVAQAAHWFDWPRYVEAVRRVARPGAIVAAIAYGRFEVDARAREIVDAYYDGTVGAYWPPERAHIDNGYRDLVWPWPALAPPAIAMVERWTRDEVVGYLGTWSATNVYISKHGPAAFEQLARDLVGVWPDDERREVRWPLVIKLARV